MTPSSTMLAALLPLITDLTHDLPDELRYQRLLDTLRQLLPCDAVALLRLDQDALVPLAVQGLSDDTLGRRFLVCGQPRLRAILDAPHGIRFPADCDLPDPYDGLVQAGSGQLAVHDCMGCALRIGEQPWGVLTLDALQADRFSDDDLQLLHTFASLAAATVAASSRLKALSRSIEEERRRADTYRLAAAPAPQRLLGYSTAFREMMAAIDLVAASDLTVLIMGETGVGKELVARQLHAQSRRADKVLVSVNCAALPENLVESELFGHVRGAFSGAVSDRSGKFAMADGGTLFLDEIGELPLTIQAKLLRVLQGGQLQRIGSDREHRTDIRLIAATNRDLAEEVRAGRFRADLYHRLSMFPLRVPPLRERQRDVLALAGTFIEQNRRRMGLRGLRLSAAAEQALLAHSWPGNVRELEHLIARAVLRAMGRCSRAEIVTLSSTDLDIATPGALPAHAAGLPPAHPAPAAPMPLRTAVDLFQKQLIQASLQQQGGNLAATARALGMDRANLARLTNRLGMTAKGQRDAGE